MVVIMDDLLTNPAYAIELTMRERRALASFWDWSLLMDRWAAGRTEGYELWVRPQDNA